MVFPKVFWHELTHLAFLYYYWLTVQMGYINTLVDWLQDAIKIRSYTNFLIKLWRFQNWEALLLWDNIGDNVTCRWATLVRSGPSVESGAAWRFARDPL